MTAAVRTKGLSKTYDEEETEVHALCEVTIEIPKGDCVLLLGASGSGKTSFLKPGWCRRFTRASSSARVDLDDRAR